MSLTRQAIQIRLHRASCCILLALMAGGCGQPLPHEIVELRERIFVDEEPAGAVTIEVARQQATTPSELTLIVKVGNRNFPNWSAEEQAIFYVSEGYPDSDYNVGADHDPSTCPFCKWKWKEEDSLAIVNVVDEKGEVVSVSAEKLLGLATGETIVVSGTAEIDDTGFLRIRTSKIFRRSA